MLTNAQKEALATADVQARGTLDRRAALASFATALAACGAAQPPTGPHAARTVAEHGEHALAATEDLMREHGVLRRVMLAYDELARRAHASEGFDPAIAARAARLVRAFVEDYHERAEERWVFPLVRRNPVLAPTVAILLVQHERGRALTDAINRIASQGPVGDAAAQLPLLCERFNRMYRAHAAREDTVIFPALRDTLRAHDFAELGERMEEAEHHTVGEGGFERAVSEVGQIERALGIDDLAAFTPAAAG